VLAFLFFIGSLIGWCLEVIFRRYFSSANKEKKWVNPGFLNGPYIPLYGFGLCLLYLLAGTQKYIVVENTVISRIILFVIMALCMTVIEYIAGSIFIKRMKIKLWDYSHERGNIKGIICPRFSFYWAVLGAIYYFLIHPRILDILRWLSENLAFSFVIGFFFGVFILDVWYSMSLTAKIRTFAKENDIVIINSSDIHIISAEGGEAKYYCLIVDKDFCEYFEIYIDKIILKNHISDGDINKKFLKIKNEIKNEDIYYKTAVKAEVLSLLTYLCRNYSLTSFKANIKSNKIEMVKKTIKYIQMNYNKNILIDDIAHEVGFSKYYFCHIFKEVTGFTVVSYINFLRCKNAESFLKCGIYNVSEAAQMCGFENLSYFTKTYKKYIGITPSSQK
jgi:uncharacterized membrane protein/AraC-like DNA-binding protein